MQYLLPPPPLRVSSRIAAIDVGMYIFRYVGNTNPESRIYLSLHQAPIGKGSVDFFPAEGVSRNLLTTPGDCVVVRIKGAPASVLITEYHPEGEIGKVQLRIDKIDTGAQSKPAALQMPAAPVADPGYCKFKLLGHIETRGDVSVDDTWLGSPNTPLRLEGFSIHWHNQPEGINLGYLCRSGRNGEPQVGSAGQFVGSRRQAKPITAVAFALSGERAPLYELSGQVAFAGHPPLAITPDKELSGPTGAEQLVALRLVITPRTAQASPPASSWNDPSITQIFSATQNS